MYTLGPTWPIVGPWRPARGQPQEPGVPEAAAWATSKGSGMVCVAVECCGLLAALTLLVPADEDV